MQANDPLVMIFERNQYYRRQYFLALAAFALSLVVIVVLGFILGYLLRHPTRPLYFATDNIGRLIRVTPVTVPNMSPEEVVAWTIDAVQSIYSYDYVNYRQELQDSQKYFTNYGWGNYLSALALSNNLIGLKANKQIVIAQVVGQPKLITEGLLGGAYAWKFEMPVLLTYWGPPYNDKSKFYNPLTVSIIVQRQEILKSYKGLGVVQLIATLQTSSQPQQLSNAPT
jgi:intracellular multiplication protein IcmL